MNVLWRCVVRLASMLVSRDARGRWREQWLADLHGAREIGLASWRVALGALLAAPALHTNETHEGALMPIGPLAIALRHRHTEHRVVVRIAAAALALLAIGVGLLVR